VNGSPWSASPLGDDVLDDPAVVWRRDRYRSPLLEQVDAVHPDVA
jgi:hypothetical protein